MKDLPIELHIRDDGLGFDPEGNPPDPGHFGLSMMRERGEASGVLLTITSQPGHGTELILQWTKDPHKETE